MIDAGSVACLDGLPEDTKLADPGTGYCPCWTTVLIGEGIDLYDLKGDEDTIGLTDLTGDDWLGGGGGVPRVVLRGEGHEGDGVKGQVDFSAEGAGEPADESAQEREPPTPLGLVWPGTVIGAVDHGG